MIKFMCKKCNYRFKSDSDNTNKKCPYCGEKEIIKEPSATELINEVA